MNIDIIVGCVIIEGVERGSRGKYASKHTSLMLDVSEVFDTVTSSLPDGDKSAQWTRAF